MINEKDAEYIFKSLALNKKTYDDLSTEFLVNKATLCRWMKKYKAYFKMKDNEKYCAYTYLRYAYPNEIIQKYLNGESTAQIANFYNLTDDHLIAALLRELGVQIRPVGYTSKTN